MRILVIPKLETLRNAIFYCSIQTNSFVAQVATQFWKKAMTNPEFLTVLATTRTPKIQELQDSGRTKL